MIIKRNGLQAAITPALDAVDHKDDGERDQQHDDRDGGGIGITKLGKPDHDQQRRDQNRGVELMSGHVKVASKQLFTGYRGQMVYAASCIRVGRLEQAEQHLCMAMGCANLEKADGTTKGRIMTALNAVRAKRREF